MKATIKNISRSMKKIREYVEKNKKIAPQFKLKSLPNLFEMVDNIEGWGFEIKSFEDNSVLSSNFRENHYKYIFHITDTLNICLVEWYNRPLCYVFDNSQYTLEELDELLGGDEYHKLKKQKEYLFFRILKNQDICLKDGQNVIFKQRVGYNTCEIYGTKNLIQEEDVDLSSSIIMPSCDEEITLPSGSIHYYWYIGFPSLRDAEVLYDSGLQKFYLTRVGYEKEEISLYKAFEVVTSFLDFIRAFNLKK